jgi:hypothetical protein
MPRSGVKFQGIQANVSMDKMERKPAQGMQFGTGLTGTPYATNRQ